MMKIVGKTVDQKAKRKFSLLGIFAFCLFAFVLAGCTKAGDADVSTSDEDGLLGDVAEAIVGEVTEYEPEEYTVHMVAVGDDLIHSGIYKYGEANGSDYSFMFENVKDVISAADIAIINQETIFVDDPSNYSSYPIFGSPEAIGDALIDAGFDVVQNATNHALDKSTWGIEQTINYFSDKDVLEIGIYNDAESAAEIPLMECNGLTIAFLNYTYGTNGIPKPNDYCVNTLDDEDKVRDDIRRARELADLVVVLPHWGEEGRYTPTDFQNEWTQIFLEEGVDIVIGTHPHVLEPYELLERDDGHQMLVYYSLGNFISTQTNQDQMLGGMADVTVSVKGDEISYDYTLVPTVTYLSSSTGIITTYFLSDYYKTDHKRGCTHDGMVALFEKIVGVEYDGDGQETEEGQDGAEATVVVDD